ncbi:hypothetical protein [Mycetocola saprophilus]|uniref:hypothetical protein n=1 Tax=Mycetocola saprophilus TaxID=76636 RepID=UPI003BF27663
MKWIHTDIDHLGDPIIAIADLEGTLARDVRGIAPMAYFSDRPGWRRLKLRVHGAEWVSVADPYGIAAGWLTIEDISRSDDAVELRGVYPIEATLHGKNVSVELLVSAEELVFDAEHIRAVVSGENPTGDSGSSWRAGQVQNAGDVLVLALILPDDPTEYLVIVRDERFFWVQASRDGQHISVRVDGALSRDLLVLALRAAAEDDPDALGEISAGFGVEEAVTRSIGRAHREIGTALAVRRSAVRRAMRRARAHYGES